MVGGNGRQDIEHKLAFSCPHAKPRVRAKEVSPPFYSSGFLAGEQFWTPSFYPHLSLQLHLFTWASSVALGPGMEWNSHPPLGFLTFRKVSTRASHARHYALGDFLLPAPSLGCGGEASRSCAPKWMLGTLTCPREWHFIAEKASSSLRPLDVPLCCPAFSSVPHSLCFCDSVVKSLWDRSPLVSHCSVSCWTGDRRDASPLR